MKLNRRLVYVTAVALVWSTVLSGSRGFAATGAEVVPVAQAAPVRHENNPVGFEAFPQSSAVQTAPPTTGAATESTQTSSGETRESQTIQVLRMYYNPRLSAYAMVQARVGDSEPLLFIVDTGAQGAMLFPWAVSLLQLDHRTGTTRVKISINGSDGEALLFSDNLPISVLGPNEEIPYRGIIAWLAILPDTDIAHLKMPLSAGGPSRRVAGILGLEFFGGYPLQFDFVGKTISMFVDPTEIPKEMKSHSVFVPLIERGRSLFCVSMPGLNTAQAEVVSKTSNSGIGSTGAEKNDLLLVDTGSDYVILPKSAPISQSQNSIASKSYMLNSAYDSGRHLMDSLTLSNDVTEPNIEAQVVDTVDPSVVKIPIFGIGMNFLSRFRVSIDTKRKELWLEKAANYTAKLPEVSGQYDFDVKVARDHFEIERLSDGTPEQIAGMRKGDKLLEIDGYTLDDIDGMTANRLQNGYRNQVACFMVRHRHDDHDSAIWFKHPDPYTTAPANPNTAPSQPEVFLLKKANSVLVRGAGGSEVWLPYNSAMPPPCDALPDCHWQRVPYADNKYGWLLLPDAPAKSAFGSNTLYTQLRIPGLVCAMPDGASLSRDSNTGITTVKYPDGFQFGVDAQGKLTRVTHRP